MFITTEVRDGLAVVLGVDAFEIGRICLKVSKF